MWTYSEIISVVLATTGLICAGTWMAVTLIKNGK